jgi:hypothetical protein
VAEVVDIPDAGPTALNPNVLNIGAVIAAGVQRITPLVIWITV